MYRVLLERGAGRDLGRLSSEVHDRVIAAIQAIDNRLPALHRLGGGGREYKAVYVLSDAEIGLFSDEVVVNYAP